MVAKSASVNPSSPSPLRVNALKGIKYLSEPEHISHYTTIAGLMGILESACMWASNVTYLNDRQELLYGLQGANEAIELLINKSAYKRWVSTLKKVAQEIEDGQMPNIYAACFCDSSDVLSQWRGYGGSEQGVSIVFDREKLETMFSAQKASLYPVVYGKLSASKQITAEIVKNLEEISIFEYGAGHLPTGDRRDRAYNIVSRLLPQFKHAGFEDEREWRFVVQHETLRKQVCFRSAGNVVVPYLKLGPGAKQLSSKPLTAVERLPIKFVRIGPGRDLALTKRSLELYLSAKDYSDVKVLTTRVPFRV